MKKFLIISVLFLCLSSLANAQTGTPSPTPVSNQILVSSAFVDDANRAFTEVVALRDTVQKFLVERAKTDAEKEGAKILIQSLNDAIAVRDKISVANAQLIAVYDKIIDIQNKMIERLEKQLNKPKGFFQSFLQKLKEVALIATGILLGRGI